MKSILKRIDRKLFSGLEAQYESIIRSQLQDVDTVLDVGCGVTTDSPLYSIAPRMSRIVGIDLFEPAIRENKVSGNYSEYCVMDARNIDKEFGENEFEAVIATDLIEHLHKDEALEVIAKMQKIASKKVIVFTPNGFVHQEEYEGNKYQEHHSGWTSTELRKIGFRVIGLNGLKFLRGEMADVRFRPKWFWYRISLLSQPLVRYIPSWAFHLLGVWEK